MPKPGIDKQRHELDLAASVNPPKKRRLETPTIEEANDIYAHGHVLGNGSKNQNSHQDKKLSERAGTSEIISIHSSEDYESPVISDESDTDLVNAKLTRTDLESMFDSEIV